MKTDLFQLWTYLSAQPLTGLTLTLLAYVVADLIHQRAGRMALTHPVLISVALIAGLLYGTGTPYQTYFDGAQFVHFLLGPATVALAVPIYRNLSVVWRSGRILVAGLVGGSLVAIGSAVGLAWWLGAEPAILFTVAPKSVTTPVAMGVAERLGGLPPLTAVVVILTGILGAVVGSPLLDRLGVRDPRARGLAFGVAAHGIGTARAFNEGQTTGVFSSLGLGLNALLTALLVPALAALFFT